jgi:4-diphosphocytidyl-2-C-methyl-D-erythritol kinase
MLCQPATRSLKVLAPAKLNLFLRVVRRRDDGFHELETVMTAVNLFDTLLFEPGDDTSEITLRVMMAPSQNCHSAPAESVPTGPENLVVRAASLLRDYAGEHRGVKITLIKRIPSAAGMGGGSSDAAATLAGLNRFWNLGRTNTELLTLAARLGSDIGFFLGGSSIAVCRGRGEIVEPLQMPGCLHFVVARPSTGLSTATVFKRCRPNDTNRCVNEFVRSLQQPGLSRMVRLLLNDLQAPAESLNSEVRQLHEKFNSLPVVGHQMSGSGTSYFGVCTSFRHARTVAERLKSWGIPWVHVCRSCS